jgi:phospholipase C
VISDRTFETDSFGSWGAHFILASPHANGFYQAGHHNGTEGQGNTGWGCDSKKDGPWAATLEEYYDDEGQPPPRPHHPTCVPQVDGSGPYKPSPVPWTTTLMNRMDEAGLSWRIYVNEGSWGWAICPTFADCLYTEQLENLRPTDDFVPDAESPLPELTFLIPGFAESQHNGASMLAGDNWIGRQLDAIMQGPNWESTAVFITYDDCGCFYDHVPPPERAGIRVPMVIVSPYARPGFTDSNVATFASMQAFVERTFGLPPMGTADFLAYDYESSFDYRQTPLPPIELGQRPLAPWVLEYLAEHPVDSNDPT